MCGILAVVGGTASAAPCAEALQTLRHRGPDMEGTWVSPSGRCVLGHTRLSVIDLSESGRQPMADETGRFRILLNGEIYNYLELKELLASEFRFRTKTDTEVLLCAYLKWGRQCLEKLIGMFAFIIWDETNRALFAARDRFGVKPLYCAALPDGNMALASEIKALHALGLPREPDPVAWATYLACGTSDHTSRTFWKGIESVPPGHWLTWEAGTARLAEWYSLYERVGDEVDPRSDEEVAEAYASLLQDSVSLRFRSDVPVGFNLSGGLDSSTLLWVVDHAAPNSRNITALTFATGDPRYDEVCVVRQMLAGSAHPHEICMLTPQEIPGLAIDVLRHQDEPYGGFPTLAYSLLFRKARENGIIVLLDGQGMDEQWAGYDYYLSALQPADTQPGGLWHLQGSRSAGVRPDCLLPEFRSLSVAVEPLPACRDRLRAMQMRDIRHTKIPRALRFNDRISMMHGTELREPFLDHRLVELALRQPVKRKIRGGVQKWLVRHIMRKALPGSIAEAQKRPVQTPQREWLRGVLRGWADDRIRSALARYGNLWLDSDRVLDHWQRYCRGEGDNSYYVFQWVSLGLCCELYNM